MKVQNKFQSEKAQLIIMLISLILIQAMYLSMMIMGESPNNAYERE
jgi:hypothetical protein